jgi:hypothetical protein
VGNFCAQLVAGPDSAVPNEPSVPKSKKRNGGNPARHTDPFEHPHRRLQYEAEHKGEHDRQDDLSCHITGGQHRENKKPAQKHRFDVRWYGQIVFVSSRSSSWRGGPGRVSCPSARKQSEFRYRHD